MAVPSIDHPRLCGWFYFSGSLVGKKVWLQVEPWTEICNKFVPVEDFVPGRQDRRFCHRKVFRIFRFFGFGLPLPGCLFEVALYLRGYLLMRAPREDEREKRETFLGAGFLGSCPPGHLRSFFNGWRRRRLTAAAVLTLSPAAPILKACRQT